jgi:hypothetical protein
MTDTILYSQHILGVGEIVDGILLIAATMTIHAFGMPATLKLADRLWQRWPVGKGYFGGVPVLIVASWCIVIVHLVEVVVWAEFLMLRDALASVADAFYYTLCQYVTVGSDVSLPDRWRLVGGMISMAGLLTFAWSTAVLLALAQRFEDARLAADVRKRATAQGGNAGHAKGGVSGP